MSDIDEWCALSIVLDGTPVAVALRLAGFADIAPFTREPLGLGTAARASIVRLALVNDIGSIDGKPISLAHADRLMADPAALAAIVAQRNLLYERGRAAGRAWARCPHCNEGEVVLSLLGFTTRLGAEAPYLTAADPVFLLPPSLSIEQRGGSRPPGAALASRIRFELPSTVLAVAADALGAASELRSIDPKDEAAALQRWAPEGRTQPDDRIWWRRGNPCFRAAHALSVAVARPGRGGRITPAAIVRLPAIDVYFLDALYYFTHFVDVAPHAVADTCPACGGNFFPVL